MFNKTTQAVSFCFLLVGSFYFGYLGKTTEMGLAILAGALSLAFANLDRISKFKGAGFEAEMRETKEAVDAIIAKEAEPPVAPKVPLLPSLPSLGGADQRVITALGNSRYSWRTLDGITQETGLVEGTVRMVFKHLIDDGLVVKVGGPPTYWGLTEQGQDVLTTLKGSATNPQG